MAIDPKLIKTLREKTGMGISDCKKALESENGDLEKAEMFLRKTQKEKAIKKADRPTGEGVIAAEVVGNAAILVEVACEQEPTKNNERFTAFVENVKKAAVASGAKNLEELLAAKLDGTTVQEALTTLAGTVGENVQVKRFARVDAPAGGMIGCYVHFNKKSGAICSLKLEGADANNAELKTAANDVCMHSVALRPLGLDRSTIPAEMVAKEKEVFLDQIKGKPAEMVEKIVAGKLGKFYSEKCLLEQIFVKDPDGKQTVAQFVAQAGKAAGGKAEVVGFARQELGL
jgi:elongation factor Ts